VGNRVNYGLLVAAGRHKGELPRSDMGEIPRQESVRCRAGRHPCGDLSP